MQILSQLSILKATIHTRSGLAVALVSRLNQVRHPRPGWIQVRRPWPGRSGSLGYTIGLKGQG